MDWLNISNFQGSDVGFGIAFLAGVIAFFSPCILPLIPAYVSFFTGVGINELKNAKPEEHKKYQKQLLFHSLLFVAGFLLIFVLLGLATGALGSFLATYKASLQRIGGIFLIILGLFLMELIRVPWLYKQGKIDFKPHFKKAKWANSFIVGVSFGLAWTPCIGPVLATILFLATFSGGSLEGFFLLLTFALGLGLPFVVMAMGVTKFLPLIRKFGKYLMLVQKIAGGLIIILGLIMLTGSINYIIDYLLSFI
ncbi:MAG: cytochrome c biogenesis CcdA family protein [bacterium]|nr:cytochrome c biogenesis CcdA family protein [bacterium]